MKADVRAGLAATLLLLGCSGEPQAQERAVSSSSTDGPAARRATELLRLIDSGDRAAARSYIQQNFSPAALERVSADAMLNTLSMLHDRTRGIQLHGIEQPSPTEARARIQNKLTGEWAELVVEIEPESPHRINRTGLRPAPAPENAAATARTDAEIAEELDAFVQKLIDADVFSGAVLLAKDGQPFFAKAYGTANKDFEVPNRVDTKFNLGSMNKMFTAVAIAQLAEQGKLSFDDPLARFLPDFPDPDAAKKIQIKHLLTHTSGLGSYFNQKFIESSRSRWRTVDEMMELARGESLAFEPGTRWQYSNTGFLVLGKVIEKVTGQDYFEYVREHIYEPAGMTNTDAYELDYVTPNLAIGYQKEFTDQGVVFRNNLFEHVIRGGPAGGGYSTVEDLLRFDAALRSNGLVGPEYTRRLLTSKPELSSPEYGFGFAIDTERNVVGHNGGFMGISSNLDMFLGSGYTAVVLSNYGGASPPVVSKIQELIAAKSATSKERAAASHNE